MPNVENSQVVTGQPNGNMQAKMFLQHIGLNFVHENTCAKSNAESKYIDTDVCIPTNMKYPHHILFLNIKQCHTSYVF